MSENKGDFPLPLGNADDVNKAIAMLAMRVSKLETDVPVIGGADDGKDLRPVLAATLAGLKDLRTAIVTASSELDGKFKGLEGVREENEKLKYQITHLKRSLEAEEAKNAS